MIESGMTLNAICQLPDVPSIPTVYKWLDNHPDFFQDYARARSKQADTFADMVMTEAFNSHDAQIGRLRIDALKWTASKFAHTYTHHKRGAHCLHFRHNPNRWIAESFGQRPSDRLRS